jgi:hypothetical protein
MQHGLSQNAWNRVKRLYAWSRRDYLLRLKIEISWQFLGIVIIILTGLVILLEAW